MFQSGLVEEGRQLGDQFGWDVEPLKTPGYKAIHRLLQGMISEQEAKNEFIQADLKLAKKQRTWFKRNNSIHWLNDPKEAVALATTLLNKKQW
jgi:tRNA dimethylallyltransferase